MIEEIEEFGALSALITGGIDCFCCYRGPCGLRWHDTWNLRKKKRRG